MSSCSSTSTRRPLHLMRPITITFTLIITLLLTQLHFIRLTDAVCSCTATEYCSVVDSTTCYPLLTNVTFLMENQPMAGAKATVDFTPAAAAEFTDNDVSTFGNYSFANLEEYWVTLTFANGDFVHAVEVRGESNIAYIVRAAGAGGGAYVQISDGSEVRTAETGYFKYLLTNGNLPMVTTGLQFYWAAAGTYKVYDFLVYGEDGTPNPTTHPTAVPSMTTDAPSATPSLAPSFSPTDAPTGHPTPAVCIDVWVNQPCCARHDNYNITHKFNEKYPSDSTQECYETRMDLCCGDLGILANASGFAWSQSDGNPAVYGCFGQSDNTVCDASFYNSSAMLGNVSSSTVAEFEAENGITVDTVCNCTTVVDYCIGEDSAQCGNTATTTDAQSNCGAASFVGNVTSLLYTGEHLGYDACQCSYQLHICNISTIENRHCEVDVCCEETIRGCCAGEGVLVPAFDADGYPIETGWRCSANPNVIVSTEAELDALICPDIYAGRRHYNSTFYAEWWNHTDNATQVTDFHSFCECEYFSNVCNFVPTDMPSMYPSAGPTPMPTTITVTAEPTEVFPSGALAVYSSSLGAIFTVLCIFLWSLLL